jgi:hypothetical protein
MGPQVDVERALSAIGSRPPAAAAVGALFVLRSLNQQPVMRGDIVPLPAVRIEALVDAPEAKNVMVFETGSESVKVIWFY